MKNMLCYDTLSLEDILDEKLFKKIDKIQEVAKELRELPLDRELYYGDETETLKNKVHNILSDMEIFTNVGSGVFYFTLFNRDFCNFILSRAEGITYTPNLAEPIEAQIPEILLEEYTPYLFTYLCDFYYDIIADIQLLIYGIEPVKLTTIQLARYNKESTKCGAWHSDTDSDLTMTVCINEDFLGGGIKIKQFGTVEILELPKLPIGTATLFTGKMNVHRGNEVYVGNRDLLVFWAEIK